MDEGFRKDLFREMMKIDSVNRPVPFSDPLRSSASKTQLLGIVMSSVSIKQAPEATGVSVRWDQELAWAVPWIIQWGRDHHPG